MRRIVTLLFFPIGIALLPACDDDVSGGAFDFSFPPRDLPALVLPDFGPSGGGDGGGGVRDLSTEGDLAVRDLAPAGDLLAPCGVKVNEVQIGSAVGVNDEMVELFNSCPNSITLGANVVLIARTLGDPTTVELQDLAGVTLVAGGFRMFTNTTYAGGGASDGVFPISGGDLLALDGAVAIATRQAASFIPLDTVAWGLGAGVAAMQEGATRPGTPANGKTLSRIPNGIDSNENGADFSSTSPPTPRASN